MSRTLFAASDRQQPDTKLRQLQQLSSIAGSMNRHKRVSSSSLLSHGITTYRHVCIQDFFMLFGRHQKETILNLMPDAFRDIAKQSAGSVRGDMIPVPDQDKHVFCRVLADRGYVEMNNAG